MLHTAADIADFGSLATQVPLLTRNEYQSKATDPADHDINLHVSVHTLFVHSRNAM